MFFRVQSVLSASSVIILIPISMELSGVAFEKFYNMLLINTADPD